MFSHSSNMSFTLFSTYLLIRSSTWNFHCVLFSIHLYVCNIDVVRIKIQSLFYHITPKTFVTHQICCHNTIQIFQHLYLQYFASIFIHNIGSINFLFHLHEKVHYQFCDIHNHSLFFFFCPGHICLDKIMGTSEVISHITILITNFCQHYALQWCSWAFCALSWHPFSGRFSIVNHSTFYGLISIHIL